MSRRQWRRRGIMVGLATVLIALLAIVGGMSSNKHGANASSTSSYAKPASGWQDDSRWAAFITCLHAKPGLVASAGGGSVEVADNDGNTVGDGTYEGTPARAHAAVDSGTYSFANGNIAFSDASTDGTQPGFQASGHLQDELIDCAGTTYHDNSYG